MGEDSCLLRWMTREMVGGSRVALPGRAIALGGCPSTSPMPIVMEERPPLTSPRPNPAMGPFNGRFVARAGNVPRLFVLPLVVPLGLRGYLRCSLSEPYISFPSPSVFPVASRADLACTRGVQGRWARLRERIHTDRNPRRSSPLGGEPRAPFPVGTRTPRWPFWLRSYPAPATSDKGDDLASALARQARYRKILAPGSSGRPLEDPLALRADEEGPGLGGGNRPLALRGSPGDGPSWSAALHAGPGVRREDSLAFRHTI